MSEEEITKALIGLMSAGPKSIERIKAAVPNVMAETLKAALTKVATEKGTQWHLKRKYLPPKAPAEDASSSSGEAASSSTSTTTTSSISAPAQLNKEASPQKPK